MKARALRKILNNTKYSITNQDEYIAVGSPMCHDLFRIDKKTLNLKYALDWENKGRAALDRDSKPDELLFIWDKLTELIESGEINDIINGRDILEFPLPIFTVRNGKLIKSFTDNYEVWPNTDDDGVPMYDNTHFKDEDKAIEYGLSDNRYLEKRLNERIAEQEAEIIKLKDRMKIVQDNINHLELLKNPPF